MAKTTGRHRGTDPALPRPSPRLHPGCRHVRAGGVVKWLQAVKVAVGQRLLRWGSRLVPYTVESHREWLLIDDSMCRGPKGQIPIDAAERCGFNVAAFRKAQASRSGIFIDTDLGRRLRKHREWEPALSSPDLGRVIQSLRAAAGPSGRES